VLIALEGIDGAGKSTTARVLAEQLGEASVDATFVDRKLGGRRDPYGAGRVEAMRRLIWDAEASSDSFGSTHWILLIASWYAALDRIQPRLFRGEESVVVVDGWYYRNIAKTVVRSGLDPAWLDSLFRFASEPEIVVLLDVAPATAWARGRAFTATELGRWDGHHAAPEASFCAYQDRVGKELGRMAEVRDWDRLTPSAGASPTAIAREIVAFLLPRLVTARRPVGIAP
jgi:dTMP kinase